MSTPPGTRNCDATWHSKSLRDGSLPREDETQARRRFEREAQAAAGLMHPGIVIIYETGRAIVEDSEIQFIAQELVAGQTLRQWLAEVGPIAADDAWGLLIEVAEALDAAHRAGVIHRDIKPENILRTPEGRFKITDFGLARLRNLGGADAELTTAGLALGTPRYMSPEQIQGQSVDGRSDLYSLGVTMYHLLCGRPPFEATDPLPLAMAHVSDPPPPLDAARGNDDLPASLVAIVMQLLAKRPDQRFESAAELVDAVRLATGNGSAGSATISPNHLMGGSVAAATVRLQRATDRPGNGRGRRLIRKLSAVAAVVAGGVAIGGVLPISTPDEVLRPAAGSPEPVGWSRRYLSALLAGDESGFVTIATARSGDDADPETLRRFQPKARLQMARLTLQRQQLDEAERWIGWTLRSAPPLSDTAVLARTLQVQLAERRGDPDEVDQTTGQLQLDWNAAVGSDRLLARRLERLIPEADRLRWGLEVLP